MMQLQTLASFLHIGCETDAPITGVSIDSRKILPGNLFVALSGENLNGHDYALDAEKKGAVAVLCEHAIVGLNIPELIVPDVIKALGKIASCHRQAFSIPIIALTGSNGKTSVKEMIYSILPKPSLATQGNLNNHLGVPLTLLHLEATHRYAVIELGANHIGEIAYTADLIKPDVALINNISSAHIGEFGSIEHIAQAKGEIYASLGPSGIAIINDDDAYAQSWNDIIGLRPTLRFSQCHTADIYAKDIVLDENDCATFYLCTPNWQSPVTLALPGKHHISNALAAASCCFAAGIHQNDIVTGLTQFRGVKGRQNFLKGMADATIIDDTYNANLSSVLAAIDVLAVRPGKRILILGDMAELGPFAHEHHQKIGQVCKEKKLDALFTCGQYSYEASKVFGNGAKHCHSQEEVIHLIKPMLDSNTTVLVKGSRSAAMEHVVAAILSPST